VKLTSPGRPSAHPLLSSPQRKTQCSRRHSCARLRKVPAHAAAAHSIDVCLRGERASYSHHQGFVGAALDSQLMLLSGHNAFVAAGPCDGPEFMFGDHDGEADMEPIFSGHIEASTSASLGQTLPS
jgi:hypothetical protein